MAKSSTLDSVGLVSKPGRSHDSSPSRRGGRSPSTTFYRHVMNTLTAAEIPFLVGGTYALAHYTGTFRPTKDLDVFVRRGSLDRALGAIDQTGYRTELTHPHFLGKAYAGSKFVDVIFSSGNGSCDVDDWWFLHASPGTLFDLPVGYCPIEEMIWSKSYVMERERYDGHDVAHLIRAGADRIHWPRLIARFGPNWRVLLAHLILFGFIYPGERTSVPTWVVDELLERLRHDEPSAAEAKLCRGTLLSRSQYLHDVEDQGLVDARVEPIGTMTPEETTRWTDAMREEEKKASRTQRPRSKPAD